MTINPDWLLKHFEQISEAPDAVPRIRRFILDLAVRGKLVEQNPEDEPISELLNRIETQKEQLTEAGAIRDLKLPIPIEPEIARFHIPKTWKWVHVEDIAYIEMGQSPSSEFYNQHHEGLPFYQGKADFGKFHPTPRSWCTVPTKLAQKGDVLISVRAPVGPTNVATETCCIGRGLAALRPYHGYKGDLLLLCLKQSESELEALGAGTTFVAINRKHLATFLVPLPPLAEQHRIVAKVDELMALCDEFEAAQAKRERRRDRLVAATLHGLNNGDDSSEPGGHPNFEESARFYFNHLPRLTTRPEHIQQIRQTILNLAVRGKLVPQDPQDEPASELLKRIEEEKAQIYKEKGLHKPRRTSVQKDEDFPCEIPAMWKWCNLAEISLKIHYGYTASANPRLQEIRLLRITDIQNNSVHWDLVPGCEIAHEQADQYLLADGDILIARTGGTIGKSFLVKDIPVKAVFASYLIRIRGSQNLFDRYLKLFLESPVYWTQLESGSRGAGQPNVNGQTLGNMVVSVPPLAEQHRIVAKVNELMALCDELEARVTTTAATRRQLLEATLHEAVISGV